MPLTLGWATLICKGLTEVINREVIGLLSDITIWSLRWKLKTLPVFTIFSVLEIVVTSFLFYGVFPYRRADFPWCVRWFSRNIVPGKTWRCLLKYGYGVYFLLLSSRLSRLLKVLVRAGLDRAGLDRAVTCFSSVLLPLRKVPIDSSICNISATAYTCEALLCLWLPTNPSVREKIQATENICWILNPYSL
jgi:hypothetical protein